MTPVGAVTAVVFELQDRVGEALGSLSAHEALPGLAEAHLLQSYPWPYVPGDLAYALALMRSVRTLVDTVAALVEEAARAAGVTGPVALLTLAESVAADDAWLADQGAREDQEAAG